MSMVKKIATDQEGYIQNMDDWSEDYAVALAKKESLELMQDHWDVITSFVTIMRKIVSRDR